MDVSRFRRGLMPELAAPILPHDREEDGGETPSALADAAKAGGIYILPSTNYIGELAELISRRHYNPPDYAETEKGPPHLREFTCQVTVGNLVETGKSLISRNYVIFIPQDEGNLKEIKYRYKEKKEI